MPNTSTPDHRIRLLKTFHVIYQHVDFEKAKQFLLDFGFTIALERQSPREIYFSGYGTEPYHYVCKAAPEGEGNKFLGAAYFVESREELEHASRLSTATGVENLDAPGGGEKVTVTDPIGFKIHLIWGAKEKAEVSPPVISQENIQQVIPNYEVDKARLGKFHRFKPGPAPVFRWGHYGITYPPGMYQVILDFYSKNFNLTPTDITTDKETGKDVCAFMHLDREKEFVDHHCFFFKRAKLNQEPNVAHAAFEVHDFDVQHLGHDFLASKGYKSCWGVGRHILGSQVFDYWFDTSGFMIEHFADGDVVNEDTLVSKVVASPEILSVWGPKCPPVF